MSLFDKPRVMEKLRSFHSYVGKNNGEMGIKVRGIDVNFNNRCNFKCKHCFARSPLGDHVKEELPIDKIRDISNQADELGIFEYDLQGGELLLRPDKLFEVIKAINCGSGPPINSIVKPDDRIILNNTICNVINIYSLLYA